MYDKEKIIAGLVIFVVIISFPFWFNQGKAAPVPEPKLTEKAKAAKTCILPKEEMRTEHMQLLEVWRQSVVRDAQRVYVASSGKEYLMSLSNNCMDCHSNKAEFCDRCHNYASVDPYCWDCHIYPEEKK
ncbi:MAG: sulfate reduction electron transfer complex DsrMKJOP subunit DsrJ [Deltaproteobacteria bacterium]|nr:sulfate reduction electron transfer complex DsrMKJOP subunit DsrJ [Deltaproteobacteria bacterium]